MLPILQPGDIVYLKQADFRQAAVDEILLVLKGGQAFIHRVIYKTGRYLVTRGDNNPQCDGRVYPRNIIGRTYLVKRQGQAFDPESLYLIQSTLYFPEIVKVKRAFEEAGIEFVFLKGLPLHLYYRRTHPRRVFADCDILIDKKDFPKAGRIMTKLGYLRARNELSATHKRFKDKESEYGYYKEVGGVRVVFDLHLETVFMLTQIGKLEALYSQSLIDRMTAEFLNSKRSIRVHREAFPVLDPSSLVVYLALHLFHHNFSGTYRYELMDKVIRRSGFRKPDWEKMAEMVGRYQVSGYVYPVFVLLKKYYHTPIPGFFLGRIRPAKDKLGYLKPLLQNDTLIFDDEPRLQAGRERFKHLFHLSPKPLWQKMGVFINRAVIYSVWWLFWMRARRFFWPTGLQGGH